MLRLPKLTSSLVRQASNKCLAPKLPGVAKEINRLAVNSARVFSSNPGYSPMELSGV
jgi:hypothetical protein